MSHYPLHSHNKIWYLINKIIKPLPTKVKENWEMQITCNTVIVVIRQWKGTMRRPFVRLICYMSRSGCWQRKHYSASRSTDDKITDITSNILHRTQKIASETANKKGWAVRGYLQELLTQRKKILRETQLDTSFINIKMERTLERLGLSLSLEVPTF
jgi:hypothetical protein